ncbi:MAG: hypothetical protein ABIP11_06705 [Luteimonas sp.]
MNRKLHHSLIAMSATAAVFGVLLLAAAPVPSPVVQPTLSISLPGMRSLPVSAALAMEDAVQSASQRRHLRHSRALLAMPYFSFAQGLRRNRS